MQLCALLFCFLSLLLPHTYTRTFFVFTPSPFIFALFPDSFRNPSGSSPVRSPSNQGESSCRLSLLHACQVGSVHGLGSAKPPRSPLPFLGSLLGGQVFVGLHLFPCWFSFAAPKYRFTPILVFRELVFSSFPTPFGSSFRSAVLAVPRFLSPFLGVYLLAQLSDLAHVSAKSKFQSFSRIRLGQSEAPCAIGKVRFCLLQKGYCIHHCL